MSCCEPESDSCNAGTNISAVILDLDGTLLDTENATKGIVKEFLAKYGKEVDKEREEKKRLGMTLQVSAAALVKDYDLPLTPDQFIDEIMPMYHDKWLHARALPGADRLIKHLYKHGVPFALASNSLREYIEAKISRQKGWKDCFSVILGSDQVKLGKPAPDLFLEAARKMGVDEAQCLVIEDSLVGVKAAKAAKMKVLAIPSPSEADCYLLADGVLYSLLEFQPEQWGLPPFDDWVNGALPIDPIYMSILCAENGSVQEISDDGKSTLPHQVSGVYFGWAIVDKSEFLKVLVCTGHESSTCTAERIIQIHVIDGNWDNISDQQVQVVLVGYIKRLNNEGIGCTDVVILEEYKSIARASLDLQVFAPHFPAPTSNGC